MNNAIILYLLSIINLILYFISSMVYVIFNNIAAFHPIDYIKTRYSYIK